MFVAIRHPHAGDGHLMIGLRIDASTVWNRGQKWGLCSDRADDPPERFPSVREGLCGPAKKVVQPPLRRSLPKNGTHGVDSEDSVERTNAGQTFCLGNCQRRISADACYSKPFAIDHRILLLGLQSRFDSKVNPQPAILVRHHDTMPFSWRLNTDVFPQTVPVRDTPDHERFGCPFQK